MWILCNLLICGLTAFSFSYVKWDRWKRKMSQTSEGRKWEPGRREGQEGWSEVTPTMAGPVTMWFHWSRGWNWKWKATSGHLSWPGSWNTPAMAWQFPQSSLPNVLPGFRGVVGVQSWEPLLNGNCFYLNYCVWVFPDEQGKQHTLHAVICKFNKLLKRI